VLFFKKKKNAFNAYQCHQTQWSDTVLNMVLKDAAEGGLYVRTAKLQQSVDHCHSHDDDDDDDVRPCNEIRIVALDMHTHIVGLDWINKQLIRFDRG
jgi:hypothetical protein